MPSQGTQIKAPRKAFTLVELLVVIGIIAVLIGILLPALNKAREQSRVIKCMSNLRVLGQASLLYSIDNRNCFLPSVVFGFDETNTGAGVDYWPELLINGKYLPKEHLSSTTLTDPTTAGPISFDSVLVCPSVQSDFATANSIVDGVRREYSTVLDKGSAGVTSPMWVDWSYGINGTSYSGGNALMSTNPFYPCTSISMGKGNCSPLKKRSMTKISSDLVFMFDGKEWNIWNSSGDGANIIKTRIAGWRHGGWLPSKPDSSGRVNVSFMDGHVATFPRSQLPGINAAGDGSFTNPTPDQMNSRFFYPKWRLDQERGGAGIAQPPPSR